MKSDEKIHVAEIIDENRFRCHCPFHDDSTPSLFVDLTRGAYCFAGCYSGDVVGLVAKLTKKDRFFIRANLYDYFEFDVQQKLPLFSNQTVDFSDAKDWFRKKGFTDKTALYWKIEFEKSSFTLPIRDMKAKTVGSVVRNIVSRPKYLYSKGFNKREYLFGENYFESSNKVVVVEGILDVLWLWQNNVNSLGLMGTIVTLEQQKKLTKLNITNAFFDNDSGGILGAKKFKALFPLAKVDVLNIRTLSKQQILEVL